MWFHRTSSCLGIRIIHVRIKREVSWPRVQIKFLKWIGLWSLCLQVRMLVSLTPVHPPYRWVALYPNMFMEVISKLFSKLHLTLHCVVLLNLNSPDANIYFLLDFVWIKRQVLVQMPTMYTFWGSSSFKTKTHMSFCLVLFIWIKREAREVEMPKMETFWIQIRSSRHKLTGTRALSVEFLRTLGSQSSVSVWQHTQVG